MTQLPEHSDIPLQDNTPPADSKRRFLAQAACFATGGIALASMAGSPAPAQTTGAAAGRGTLRVFETVDAMLTAAPLEAGLFATTLGYHAPGDGGGALYAILDSYAGDEGPDELGEFTLSGGGYAVLQHDGSVAAEQFGATEGRDCSKGINTAMVFLRRWQRAHEQSTYVKLSHSSAGTLSRQVRLCGPKGRKLRNLNLDFTQSNLMAVDGGNLDEQTAALYISARGYHQMGRVNGGRICPCYDLNDLSASTMIQPVAWNFIGWGIKVRGPSGNFTLIRPQADELIPASPLYDDESNYVADAFIADDGDFFVLAGKFRWARRTAYLTENAHTIRFTECHFVNGNAAGRERDIQRNDPIIVENDSRIRNFLTGCYLDNGHIRDNGNSLQIHGGHYIVLKKKVNLKHPYIRVYASKENQDGTRFQLSGLAASVGFFPGKDGTDWEKGWTGPDEQVNQANWKDQARTSRRVSFASRLVRMFPGGGEIDEVVQKPWGIFRMLWRNTAGAELALEVDPEQDEIALRTGTLRAGHADGAPGRVLVGDGQAGIAGRQDGLELLHGTGGTINVGMLPSSAGGLKPGDLWNDGGTLKVVS